MARRVSDYPIRRIADRGNEEDCLDSRARGDRFYRNRRSADRGNEKVDRDPGIIYDYHPAYDEYEDEEWYYWMTGAGVTDDSTGYVTNSLLSLKGRRILAVDSSPPCFDCCKDYWCVTRALNVVVVQERGTVQEEITGSRFECVKVSAGILNDFVMSDKTKIGGVNGLVPLVANGDRMAKSTANEVVFPYIEPRIMDELNVCSVKEEIKEVVSQFFNSKIQNIIVNAAGHNGDKYTPKAIIGFIAGNCMDEKVACGCGMHGLFQLTCGGSIDKQRKPVEPNKEVCMKTELDDATTKFDGQIRGIDYVFDPGGWFLKLSKLEDEFFFEEEENDADRHGPIRTRVMLMRRYAFKLEIIFFSLFLVIE